MAEGNYPFPSEYITFSMGLRTPFPAWPMRKGCASGLDQDLGVKVQGDVKNIRYDWSRGPRSPNDARNPFCTHARASALAFLKRLSVEI